MHVGTNICWNSLKLHELKTNPVFSISNLIYNMFILLDQMQVYERQGHQYKYITSQEKRALQMMMLK